MSWLRALAFNIAFFAVTAMLGVAGLPMLLAPRRSVMSFGRFWARCVLALLRAIVGLDGEIRGIEHLPPGASIIAMKHQSAWDTFAVPVIFPNPAMVIKRELGWIPFYGWYALKAGMIPVDRSGRATALKRMVAASEKALAAGRPILIFPEGTRSAVGARVPYQQGVAALYRQLGVPLVPVAVNSGLFWGRRQFLKRPGTIIVEILPAIPPGGERRIVMAELENRIETATTRLVSGALEAGDKTVENSSSANRGSWA
jgi:1-acyl-sn-glycerol-3-phosphate acyltransferase